MSQEAAIGTAKEHMPDFLHQRKELEKIEPWIRGEQGGSVFVPANHDIFEEYEDLADRAPTAWIRLIIRTLNQNIFYEGIRRPGIEGNMGVWETWRRNGWIARQIPLHYDAIGHGVAFATALPGTDPLSGEKRVSCRGHSGLNMAAWYGDDGEDEYPIVALRAEPTKIPSRWGGEYDGWSIRLIDEVATYYMQCRGEGQGIRDWDYIDAIEHNIGVTPVQRFAPYLDLQNIARSEATPLIPLARRIDQDVFDRLIVQRFGAWKVRYILGLVRPKDMTDDQYKKQLIEMKISDFLTLEDPDSKVGVLDATDLKGFIEAEGADLRTLSAVSQTPPHQMLGLSTNMQAESLAAVEAGLQRKAQETKNSLAQSHQSYARLCATISGNVSEARAYDAEMRWRDMESRALTTIADALQKLKLIGLAPEVLWEMLPNWSDDKTERNKQLNEAGVMAGILAELEAQANTQGQPVDAGV